MFKASTNKKISMALGILTVIGLAVVLYGDIWGFQALAKQIFGTISGTASLMNVYFLGSTAEKISKDKK